MNYAQVLGALGLTQALTESILIVGLVALGVGIFLYMFWHFILIGLGIFGVLMVFAHHEPEVKVIEKKPEVVDQAKEEYMEDCGSLTQKPQMCEELWKERQADTVIKEPEVKKEPNDGFKLPSQVKLLDVDNQEYKQRRAIALAKPNAVVLQETVR